MRPIFAREESGVSRSLIWLRIVAADNHEAERLFLVRLTLSSDGRTITRVFTQKDDPEKRHEI
jgi:hypothetical protein